MALDTTSLPFGLRDIKIRPMAAGSETLGAPIDMPNARTFTFSETSDNEELRGDDGIVAVHDLGSGVDWELESGGVPLEAIAAMYGGEINTTGVSPDQIKTYEKLDTDVRPYFEVEGQAISDSGGDFHVTLHKAKATGELSGEMTDGSFWLTGASGRAIGRTSDRKLYTFTQNETTASIVPTDEIQTITILGSPSGGTFTITFDSQTTAGIAYNATGATVQTALEALSNIAPGDVAVVGGAGGPYTVTFGGAYDGEDVPQMTVNTASLTGGSAVAVVDTTQEGGE